jgi:acyl-CoA thioester hydrolase
MRDQEITYRGSIYPAQCDHMGHMNVMWYVGKFDEATWNFFTGLGISPTYLRENNRGMAAIDQHITYSRELMAGDIVTIHTRLVDLSGKVIKFRHEMINGETAETAATTDLIAVHMDTDARKSLAFPDQIIENGAKRLKHQGDA